MFKDPTTGLHLPSRPTDSVKSGRSQLNAKASDFIQASRSVSVSFESIQPSLLVAQHPISLPGISTSPKDVPDPLDWSVDFNSNVKPALIVKLEHVLMLGVIVWRVKFSPDGKYLAVGVDDGRTYIYDMKTGAKSWSVTSILVWRMSIEFHDSFHVDTSKTRKRGVWSLCFSPDGKYLAVGVFFGELRVHFLLLE